MKTIINNVDGSWKNVKNKCRTTINKEYSEVDASPSFIYKLLISEHSPIRLISVDWSWKKIPYWVSTEWSRHKFEKFISTQRTDRTGIERAILPQGVDVNFDGYANAQNLIDAWRKRLCFQATPEARGLAMDFKLKLQDVEVELANVLVPNCVYRGGCPEFVPCDFYGKFVNYCYEHSVNMNNIQSRYDAYNEFVSIPEWLK